MTIFPIDLLASDTDIKVSKLSKHMYEVILQFPFSNTGKPNGVVSDFQMLQTAFFVVVSVLCFLESVILHYDSSQDECPAVVSVVSPQLLILGRNGVSGSV